MEKLNCKHPQLNYEYKILSIIAGPGIPKVYQQGVEGEYVIMIMEKLGKNLEELFNLCDRKFSLKTVLMIFDQIIKRIEYIHTKNFIHRDIKPENFLIGLGSKTATIYIIDFGLSKKFRDPLTGRHIAYSENKSFTGTARYASISTHLGVEQSRRDDLEAVGHLLLYFIKGCLPWQGLQATSKKEKYDKILNKKKTTSVDILCKGLPIEFGMYMNYCRGMKFNERPDYSYMGRLFKDLYFRESYFCDGIFDWNMKEKVEPVPKEIQELKEEKKKLDDKYTHFKLAK